MEVPGIEPGAFHMQSERSTTEPHPHLCTVHSLKRQWLMQGSDNYRNMHITVKVQSEYNPVVQCFVKLMKLNEIFLSISNYRRSLRGLMDKASAS